MSKVPDATGDHLLQQEHEVAIFVAELRSHLPRSVGEATTVRQSHQRSLCLRSLKERALILWLLGGALQDR